MDSFLNKLRKFDALRDGDHGRDELSKETVDSVPPTYADDSVFDRLSPKISDALRCQKISRLYQHQADAILQALDGANVVLEAPTASGKTLSFAVPVLEKLVHERDAHALMIYPNKALANDQRDQLTRLSKGLRDAGGHPIKSWWYDGGTDNDIRKKLRSKPPHILITNPDMLHGSFLGWADQWQKFLRGLKYVVIDEIHEYRGYFGSNVSLILRRFSHHLNQLGNLPQYFLASATCANAKEHAEKLTGLDFNKISAVEKLRPRRKFYFIKPDIPSHKYWKILQYRTVLAGLTCMTLGQSVLAFCPTRKFAEDCYQIAKDQVEKMKNEGRADLSLDAIEVFRGGLSTDKRREIQDALRAGRIKLVFTTNALELGIDIGSLDGVIISGFPDSIMSAWQRIGRAGRSWDTDAFVIYYALNNPLDQFYASNLKMFLKKPLDELVINSDNEELVERHLPCLMFETPTPAGGEKILGQSLYHAAQSKVQSGSKPLRVGNYRPHPQLNIRGGGLGMYTLSVGEKDIGTMSGHQQFREAYERAIYLHGGSSYRVTEVTVSSKGGTIKLNEAAPHLRTRAVLTTSISTRDLFVGYQWQSGVSAIYSNVTVNENLRSIEEFEEGNDSTIDKWTPKSNNAQYSNAHALQLKLEFEPDVSATDTRQGVIDLQHLLRVGTLFTIPVESHDVIPHAVVGEQTVYLVESYPGGIGIARKTFEKWREVLKTGIDIAESCRCPKGCANCIVPPRSTDVLDKHRGIALARKMLAATEQNHDYELRDGIWNPVA